MASADHTWASRAIPVRRFHLSLLVRRNDDAVKLVVIGGDVAVENGQPTAALGAQRMGRVLVREGTPARPRPAPVPSAPRVAAAAATAR